MVRTENCRIILPLERIFRRWSHELFPVNQSVLVFMESAQVSRGTENVYVYAYIYIRLHIHAYAYVYIFWILGKNNFPRALNFSGAVTICRKCSSRLQNVFIRMHMYAYKNSLCCGTPVVNMPNKTKMLIVEVEKHPILYDKGCQDF